VAQHKSAVKRIRRNNRAATRNSQYMASVRTAVKKFRQAATAAASDAKFDKATIGPLFVEAQSALAKAATKGIIHVNNAGRKIGRLAAVLKIAEGATPVAAKVAKKTISKKSAAATVKAKKAAKASAVKPKNSTPAKKVTKAKGKK